MHRQRATIQRSAPGQSRTPVTVTLDAATGRDQLARLVARTARRSIRISGRGQGSTLPGRLAERVSPGVLARAAKGLDPLVLVSGTNGKTTTTALLSAALRAAGHRVVTNATGSNLRSGLTSALVCHRGPADCAVLEVDEATMPRVVGDLRPNLLVLLNLSRDQLDRYHEVRSVGAAWRTAATRLGSHARVVAVDHDPLVCYAAQGAPEAVMVGVSGAHLGRDHAGCPACGDLLGSNRGRAACPGCQWQPGPRQVEAFRQGSLVRLRGLGEQVHLSLPVASPGYAANATAAWAAAVTLGVDATAAARAIAGVKVVEARYAEVGWRGRTVRLLLAKNPAGWDEVLAAVAGSERPAVVSLEAGIPDGRDTSWFWDVDIRALRNRPVVVASGSRARDVALRLGVAGVNYEVEPRLDRALALAGGKGGALDLLADYTSFQAARRLVGG
ncbi:MAG TPA: MurT ligase domain-containing protein [Actinomycetota bacterium]